MSGEESPAGSPPAGRFLSIEGVSGAGKSTLARRIAAKLEAQGVRVVHTRDPGGTPAGRTIRSLLLDRPGSLCPETEVALFFADRAQNLHEVIGPALARGDTVIADRFTDSTIAYQGAARGLPRDRILAVDQAITGGCRPDLTLLLDLPAETGLARLARADRIEQEGARFQERVRQGFLDIARADPDRVKVISADGSTDAVFTRAWAVVRERLS